MSNHYNPLANVTPLTCYLNYNEISGEETKPMERVTLTNEEYAQLIEARRNIEIIRAAAEADDRSYGYDADTAKVIDIVLGIKRGTTGGEE